LISSAKSQIKEIEISVQEAVRERREQNKSKQYQGRKVVQENSARISSYQITRLRLNRNRSQ